MKRVVKKVAKDIAEIAKTNNISETEFMQELNELFNEKMRKSIIKMYTKNKKKKDLVLDICKEYKISSKTFYKILKENDVEINRKYSKSEKEL